MDGSSPSPMDGCLLPWHIPLAQAQLCASVNHMVVPWHIPHISWLVSTVDHRVTFTHAPVHCQHKPTLLSCVHLPLVYDFHVWVCAAGLYFPPLSSWQLPSWLLGWLSREAVQVNFHYRVIFVSWLWYFFCFWTVLRVKLRASLLLGRYSVTWAMPPPRFSFVFVV
jgi:hypothetical protein